MFKKIISVILVTLCVFTVSCTSKLEKVKQNINDKDIELAVENYNKLNDDEKSQIDEIIKGLVDEQYQLFMNGKINGINGMAEVIKLNKFDGSAAYSNEVKNKISTIYSSRQSFEKGQKQEEAKNFYFAIEGYKGVDELDAEHYETAQKKIEELQVIVDAENKKKEEENLARKEAQNNRYKIISTAIVPTMMGINDGIQVLVQNNTDVAIKEISIGFFIYDRNGLPIKFGILAGGVHYLGAKDTNANIMPGETYGSDKAVDTYLDTGTVSYVKALVLEVIDYDGNKWTNSEFNKWFTDNYDEKYQ